MVCTHCSDRPVRRARAGRDTGRQQNHREALADWPDQRCCRSAALAPRSADDLYVSTAHGSSLPASGHRGIIHPFEGRRFCPVRRCAKYDGCRHCRHAFAFRLDAGVSTCRFDARRVSAISPRRHPSASQIADGSGTGSVPPSRARWPPQAVLEPARIDPHTRGCVFEWRGR